MKLIKLTFEQCSKISPLELTGYDCDIRMKIGYKMYAGNYLKLFQGDVGDAMIMKIRTQLPGKPADKQVATLTALRLQGFI